MKKRFGVGLVLVALALSMVMIFSTVVSASASSNGLTDDEINAIVNTTTDASAITSPFIEVSNKVRNTVVGVNNYTLTRDSGYGFGFGFGYGYGNRQSEPQETLAATGSGVVISQYGHVLTNYHVVEGATRVTVTTGLDETEHDATVINYDANQDIAVLLVEGLENVPVAALGDSDQIQVGEWAIVIGNPLGERYARTLTVGAVSGLDRQITDRSTDRYGRLTTITNAMIQVDAAINSGNSGGGLFNILGQLQGIPARKYGSSSIFSADVDNIGLCIPINVAKPLITEALQAYNTQTRTTVGSNSDDNGQYVGSNGLLGRPRAGITVTTLSYASYYGLPQGALVQSVEAGSPAEEAGIQAGDIIVEVDGDVVTSSISFTSKVSGHDAGDTLQIKVYRDEALAQQIKSNEITMEGVGEGDYIDLSITLRVIDNVNS